MERRKFSNFRAILCCLEEIIFIISEQFPFVQRQSTIQSFAPYISYIFVVLRFKHVIFWFYKPTTYIKFAKPQPHLLLIFLRMCIFYTHPHTHAHTNTCIGFTTLKILQICSLCTQFN